MDLALLYSQLIGIEGLDMWEGLSHVGYDRKGYADALRLFCGEFEKNLGLAVSAAESDNWKDYTFALHAVKGLLAGIGAWELSRKALELESASREGNYEPCRRDSGAVFREMEALAGALRGTALFDGTGGESRAEASPETLAEKLRALAGACAAGNSAEAETLAEELRGKTFGPEADEFVESLCARVDALDYDRVLEALRTINNREVE
ncbi:MAG: Hpt domain-containing protein [Treponema sp.]|jgi:HPt (histidine-containing phosphotransfer) domain-containing protein|nr:Hpt domain-containing protein [Treponema sp.]